MFREFYYNHIISLADLSHSWTQFIALCERHPLEFASFSPIFQFFLVTGFAYHNINKVKELINSLMASNYCKYEASLIHESKQQQSKIEAMLPSIKVPSSQYSDLVELAERFKELSASISNRRENILNKNGKTFYILGLHCLIILMACGFEAPVQNGWEYLRFKNALVFFNFQVFAYLIVQYFFENTNENKSYNHVIYIIIFILISLIASHYINFTYKAVGLISLTFAVLLLPFLFIILSAYRLRVKKTEKDYEKKYSTILKELGQSLRHHQLLLKKS